MIWDVRHFSTSHNFAGGHRGIVRGILIEKGVKMKLTNFIHREELTWCIECEGQSKSSRNCLTIDGLAHHEFALPGQNVICRFYVQVLHKLRAMQFGGSIESHIACSTNSPPRKSIPVITQPPYSLELAPSDLAAPYSENRPQRDTFCNRGRHEFECGV
jgi:hypothetical protein